MKKLFFFSLMLHLTISLFADLPGSSDREDVVIITGINNLPKDWLLYSRREYSDEAVSISKDTSIIEHTKGAPTIWYVFARNMKTGKRTPEISMRFDWGRDNEKLVNDIQTIRNDSLIVQEKRIEAKSKNKEETTNIVFGDTENHSEGSLWLLIGVALVSLTLLAWIYLSKRKSKQNLNS